MTYRGRGQEERDEIEERVVRIDRTRKTVKGGRISSVRVVAAVGNGKGSVGLGVGKARDIPEAIEKAIKRARENMIRIPMDGYTIPHLVQAKVGGAVILLRPASRGTGVVAGGATRQILEVSGIRDILTKSLGSGNVFNRAQACFKALQILHNPADIAAERDMSVEEMLGRTVEDPYAELEAEEAEQAAEEAEAEQAAQEPAAAEEPEAAEAAEAPELVEAAGGPEPVEVAEAPELVEAAEGPEPVEAAEGPEPVEVTAEPEEGAEEAGVAGGAVIEDTMTDSLTDLFIGDEKDEED